MGNSTKLTQLQMVQLSHFNCEGEISYVYGHIELQNSVLDRAFVEVGMTFKKVLLVQ